MAIKKSTTKKARGKSRDGRKPVAQWRRELARDLASILRNPTTPPELYNELSDLISTFESESEWYTAPYIERALENYARVTGKRSGGVK